MLLILTFFYSFSTVIPVITPIPVPCQPSPCGANAVCQVMNGHEACSCLPGYIGPPPNCRPECVINSECPSNKACINFKCGDPCVGACGISAKCDVANHNAICSCPYNLIGDPFSRCYEKPIEPVIEEDACNPNPCGLNARCEDRGSSASCTCPPNYLGNPYIECKPECQTNSDCPYDKSCISQKCRDPCPGSCGANADCRVVSHNPICSCPPGYTGDPLESCRIAPPIGNTQPFIYVVGRYVSKILVYILQNQSKLILVIQILAELTVKNTNKMVIVFVHACQDTSVWHQIVNLNVLSVQIVA